MAAPDAAPIPTGPPTLVEHEVTIEDILGRKATLRVFVPSTWVAHGTQFGPRNDLVGIIQSGVGFGFGGISCDGPECTEKDFARMIREAVDGAAQHWEHPNYNTGDAARDAVRLDVTELEKGAIPDGAYRAFRVKKPAGLDGPYPEVVVAVCARHRKGDAFYISTSTIVPLRDEATDWALALEGCKKTEVK